MFEIISESRETGRVRSVVLRDYGQLLIEQGATESLRLEGTPDVMAQVNVVNNDGTLILDIQGGWFDKAWKAFTSAVEGKPLKYFLTVREIEGIWVSGAGSVKIQSLKSPNLKLILKGAGELIISRLETEKLEVELPGAGIISLAGRTHSQHVVIRGAGSYDAPRLESSICHVDLRGVGKASIWATGQLDASVDGVGAIEYYGEPEARKSVSGLGKINQRFV